MILTVTQQLVLKQTGEQSMPRKELAYALHQAEVSQAKLLISCI